MREIGVLVEEREARLFADYLLAQGITTKLDAGEQGTTVWVRDEERVTQASAELDAFRQSPGDEKYLAARREADKLRRAEAERAERLKKNMVDVRRRWARPSALRCPATITLIVLSVLVAAVTRLGTVREPWLDWLQITRVIIDGDMMRWRVGLPEIADGHVWRLITPIFVHFGALHLLFNMSMLWLFGSAIEFLRGHLRMALMVLGIAVASNLAEYYWSSPNFGGMSGVIYGLFGYAWMKSKFDPRVGISIPPNLVMWLLAWLVLGFINILPVAMANAAHLGGLAAGMVIGYTPVAVRKLRGK